MRRPSTQLRSPAALVVLVLTLLLAGLGSAASALDEQDSSPRQTPPAQQKQERPTLSPEDAALVQQLALVEHVELLRHLELFEKEPAALPKKQP